MKTFLTTLFCLFAFATASASVNPIDLIIMADRTSKTVILRTTTDVEHPTRIEIIDARGATLYVDNLATGDFLNKRFELSTLPQGKYQLVVEDTVGRTVQPIEITNDVVVANPREATRHFFPSIRLKDANLLTINYLNPSGKQVAISVKDDEGNEVFADRIKGVNSVQKMYDLQQLPAAKYTVTLTSRDVKNYVQAIALK
ncbi:hypothetical protein [Lewinella sp. W8]|uniref:hypothetical protein n=1 Tax=Lewinella sp. W8 TaxID=2528208 RepID=UPI00106896E4|nr:hypothetical protein [Lewinella sp. W8]MTB50759.1 hypothetical protein [Lewinella sp. W8]